MPFIIGETVGPYQILEQLGQGGMATVYKAYHAALDRHVAIKVLHPAFTEDKNFTARFQREAKVVAKLDHPNIVPIFDFSEHEGRPYLVMKYIEGETLKALLARKHLSFEDTLPIVEAVGTALAYAHKRGVVHRDIKPSNVIISYDDQIYLTDFGLARIAQVNTSTLTSDQIVGTPQYISPEQAMSKSDLDFRTDIYSLCVMMYEMTVGRVPYNADTPFAVIHDHIYTPLPLPRKVNPAVSETLERVLLKGLAKKPDDRYEDVNSLVKAYCNAIVGGTATLQKEEPIHEKDSPPLIKGKHPPIPPIQGVEMKSGSTPPKIPEEKTKGKKRKAWFWILGSIGIIIMCCLLFNLIGKPTINRIQSSRTQTADANFAIKLTPLSPMETPLSPAKTDWKMANENLDQAIQAWRNGDMPLAIEMLRKAYENGPDDQNFYWNAFETLKKEKAWLLAAMIAFNPRVKDPERYSADRNLVLHEILYRAAVDPLAGEFFGNNTQRPMFLVANLRFQMYQQGKVTQDIKDKVTMIAADEKQTEEFPEIVLMQMEMETMWGRKEEALSISFRITENKALPDWVRQFAMEFKEKINRLP